MLGERKFDEMAEAYLTDCPSESFTLRNLGSRLEGWLRKHSRWADSRQHLAVDMARLEWADIEAFDGKMETPLKPKDLGWGESREVAFTITALREPARLALPGR